MPWQGTRDPYRVWLSEIMLQQTQVATAEPYYHRFLERFATVADLAAAPLDDVLALWSGLGYYSRARNLHRCAQAVVSEHGGLFPAHSQELVKLPGIGRSTAAAIAAFCADEPVAILDANVKRVLARHQAWAAHTSGAAQERAMWEYAQSLVPERDIAAYTQGMMDLGATVCTARAAHCDACPIAGDCQTAAAGEPLKYPIARKRLVRSQRSNLWLWLQWCGMVWLVKRPETGIWAGLWSLPELAEDVNLKALSEHWHGHMECLPSRKHVLTHLDWWLHPRRFSFAELPAREAPYAPEPMWGVGQWFSLDDALALGLPAPLRRLLQGD